ncbi:hypothetical protein KAT36_04750 [Candidatus Pacearchaeota archaeon]|nr:hypothetical protein [Candidatus Pacearchaeota archaeon]
MVSKVNVVFGGWYQRTTLHLSEVHRFLLHGTSDLDLSKVKLKALRHGLGLKSVKRNVGYLEYLEIETRSGIGVKYFEDGLYILSEESDDIDKAKSKIKKYFDEKFQPAINYLFSLGAPTPKILSNMEEVHPFVIERVVRNPAKSGVGKEFGEVYSETKSSRIKVSKTKENIFVDVVASQKKELEMLTEMQIFFSDFKLQLHKYLDIHRKIWEEIGDIKEKEFIRGEDVGEYKAMLDSYQKTVQLINNRINQMSNYAKTRRDISERVRVDRNLNELFQYRFEDLFNTLEYIKEVWNMTLDYVNSAIRVMEGVENKASSSGLKSIQLLVSVGVIAGVVRYLNVGSIPNITGSSVLFVAGLTVLALGFDWGIKKFTKRKKYKLKFVERAKKI